MQLVALKYIVSRTEQFLNASLPIDSMLSGILIAVINRQPLNASALIDVIAVPLICVGISMLPASLSV